MEVVPLCPLRTAALAWQPRRGSWALTVVVKATFVLQPIETELAREQEYPNEDDNHWNDDDARSLYSPSDLVPFKPRADVMLVGHAFAPRKEPVRSLVARLIVGEVDKSIEVFGERAWSQEGLLREGPRFVKMPLRYERAAGGPDTSNPVGMRLDRADGFGNVQVPNLQPPGILLSDPSDFMDPIGFGPIAPAWPGRRDKLGRHAATWSAASLNEPFPEDFDSSFFNAAPRDQQVEALRPNERIILENLHPEHVRLVTSLPGVAPQAFVDRPGAAPHELTLACDTLWIDTDRAVCTLTWRGQTPVDHPQKAGTVWVAMAEKPGQRLAWGDVERQLPRRDIIEDASAAARAIARSASRSDGASTHPEPRITNAPLPFKSKGGFATSPSRQPPPPPPPPPPSSPKAAPPPLPKRMERPQRPDLELEEPARDELTDTGFGMQTGGALPFEAGPPALSISAKPARKSVTKTDGMNFGDVTGPAIPAFDPSRGSYADVPFVPVPDTPPRFAETNQQGRANDPNRAPAGDASPPWLSNTRASSPDIPLVRAETMPMGMPAPVPPTQQIGAFPRAKPVTPFTPDAPPVNRSLSFVADVSPMPVSPPAPAPPPPAPSNESPWAGAAATPQASSVGPRLEPIVGGSFGAPTTSGGYVAAAQSVQPPAIAPAPSTAMANAASGGVIAASNAAAAANSWSSSPTPPAPPPAGVSAGQRNLPRGAARDVVELLWFDPEALERLRAHEPWRDVLAELQPKPPEDVAFDQELPPEPTPEQQDKRDVVGILTRVDPSDSTGIQEAMSDAVTEEGLFEPPLVLLVGELQLPFDELETLKANVTAVTPLVAGDKRLKETIDTVNELLKTPWLQSSTGVAEGLTQKVRDAFAQANRIVPPSYLDSHTERMLLEQRHYQKRTMWGDPWIRSLMLPSGASTAVPAYLPDALSKQLPMFQRFKARIIAEALMQQDEYETQPIALKVIALGRVVSVQGASRRRPPKNG